MVSRLRLRGGCVCLGRAEGAGELHRLHRHRCVPPVCLFVFFVVPSADLPAVHDPAQWDGRTVPSPQWALDVTRQDTAVCTVLLRFAAYPPLLIRSVRSAAQYRFQQELKLANLIPTTAGDALIPTYTAYAQFSVFSVTSYPLIVCVRCFVSSL